MSFKAFPCSDRWYGVLAALGLLGLDALIVLLLAHRPVDGLTFILAMMVLGSLPVAAYLAYRTLGVFTLEYWVDRDAVTFVWGPTRHVVPLGQILRVQRGAEVQAERGRRFWHWPCPDCRQVIGRDLGRVHCYGTRPLPEQLVLVTPGDSYSLSPADPEGFVDALQERFALGVARIRSVEVQRPPLWRWALWRDWKALLLIGCGLLGVIFMFGVLSFRFPALASDLPLHFDVNGLPDRIAPKSGLFTLPLIGLLAWLINLIGGVWTYRGLQRQGAYLLWAGAVVVQVVAALALFNALRW